MKNKSTHLTRLLKHFALIVFTCLFFCVNAQTTTVKEEPFLQVLNSSWSKDTSTAAVRLNFTISLHDAARLSSFSITLLSESNTMIAQLGTYQLKQHAKGFFYIENVAGEKTTVLNNSIYFTKEITLQNYSPGKKIKVSYITDTNDKKSVISLAVE